MNIKAVSHFKEIPKDHKYFLEWVKQLESANQRKYKSIELNTSLGRTHVWGLNTEKKELPCLVIFPGARTTALIWDLDRGLDHLKGSCSIFMVETNGLPNLSDGQTPDIKSDDYGVWAGEVLDLLGLESCCVAGASFGGLICMKLARVHPQKVEKIFLLNPGCLQPFSLSMKNLYYNLLPILIPTAGNVRKFLDKAIFCKPHHQLSDVAEKLLMNYELFALKRYKDRTQKPYFMKDELQKVKVKTYLALGDHDLLFPYQQSENNARKLIPQLADIVVFKNVGHGIETYPDALKFIGDRM